MATVVKQGDSYALPVGITLNGSGIAISDIEKVELQLGSGIRKLYPGAVVFDSTDNYFYLPLTQEETFGLEANTSVALDVRVKFSGGNVMGTKKMVYITIADAASEEVL